MITRHTDTGLEIVVSGEFVPTGKYHYHYKITGLQVAYDRQRWAWRTSEVGPSPVWSRQ